VLGSIPVLGWLFRNDSTQKTKTNLLLFLTPYIIRDQSDFRRIFERKMAERAEFVKRFYGGDANYVAAIDYDRKLGPLQRVRTSLTHELSKAENGGTGALGEKVIGPQQRYVPQQLDPSTAKRPPTEAPPIVPPSQQAPATAPAPGDRTVTPEKNDEEENGAPVQVPAPAPETAPAPPPETPQTEPPQTDRPAPPPTPPEQNQ
jgi:general secretion pathway protein D